MPVFPAGALLQVKLAIWVENEDVNGPMQQVIPMHLGTGGVAQNSVTFVHDGEALAFGQASIGARWRRDEIHQIDPLT